MTGVDGVFHVAGWYRSAPDAARAAAERVEGTRNVRKMMAELGIPGRVHQHRRRLLGRGRLPDETYRYEGRSQ